MLLCDNKGECDSEGEWGVGLSRLRFVCVFTLLCSSVCFLLFFTLHVCMITLLAVMIFVNCYRHLIIQTLLLIR